MITRVATFVIAMVASATSGCRGGPQDESSRYCQNALEQANIPTSRRPDVCDACCHHDAVHHGRIVNAQCVCSP
jgi:hypothetical protein